MKRHHPPAQPNSSPRDRRGKTAIPAAARLRAARSQARKDSRWPHRDWRRRERTTREHRGGSSRQGQEVRRRGSAFGARNPSTDATAPQRGQRVTSGGSRHKPDWSPKTSGLPRCPRPLSRPERPRTKVRHRPAFSLRTSEAETACVQWAQKHLTVGQVYYVDSL